MLIVNLEQIWLVIGNRVTGETAVMTMGSWTRTQTGLWDSRVTKPKLELEWLILGVHDLEHWANKQAQELSATKEESNAGRIRRSNWHGNARA